MSNCGASVFNQNRTVLGHTTNMWVCIEEFNQNTKGQECRIQKNSATEHKLQNWIIKMLTCSLTLAPQLFYKFISQVQNGVKKNVHFQIIF